LVKFLVQWAAENEFDGEARQTLIDIVNTVISPELLPAGEDGKAVQATEEVIGPFELHDFFLFHLMRYGTPPEKILFLAEQAEFDKRYSGEEIRRWLRLFLQRFFGNQFKRSCLPDGPKVGSVSLSPRGDWRMPSDAQAAHWLKWADEELPATAELQKTEARG
jgi:NAD+ synthase (glutamine-hydrolysing)